MGYVVGLFYFYFFPVCSFGWLLILVLLFVLLFVCFVIFVLLLCFVSRIHPLPVFLFVFLFVFFGGGVANPYYLLIISASHVVEGCAALYAL